MRKYDILWDYRRHTISDCGDFVYIAFSCKYCVVFSSRFCRYQWIIRWFLSQFYMHNLSSSNCCKNSFHILRLWSTFFDINWWHAMCWKIYCPCKILKDGDWISLFWCRLWVKLTTMFFQLLKSIRLERTFCPFNKISSNSKFVSSELKIWWIKPSRTWLMVIKKFSINIGQVREDMITQILILGVMPC